MATIEPDQIQQVNKDASNTSTQFLHGWRKLPDELKLETLGHVLPANHLLPAKTFRGEVKDACYVTFHKHSLPVLAYSEIASLGLEVLYKQNTTDFDVVDLTERPLLLPPKPVRKHVRSWCAIIPIDHLKCQLFRTVACNIIGFPNLKHIKLHIWGPPAFTVRSLEKIREGLVAMPIVEFVTQEAEVIYTPFDADGFVPDDFNGILEEKLTIGAIRDGVKQTCERKVCDRHDPSHGTVVQNWPEELDLRKHRRQVTIKIWRS